MAARPPDAAPEAEPASEERPAHPPGPLIAITVGVGLLVAVLLALFKLFVAG